MPEFRGRVLYGVVRFCCRKHLNGRDGDVGAGVGCSSAFGAACRSQVFTGDAAVLRWDVRFPPPDMHPEDCGVV